MTELEDISYTVLSPDLERTVEIQRPRLPCASLPNRRHVKENPTQGCRGLFWFLERPGRRDDLFIARGYAHYEEDVILLQDNPGPAPRETLKHLGTRKKVMAWNCGLPPPPCWITPSRLLVWDVFFFKALNPCLREYFGVFRPVTVWIKGP